MGRKERDGGEFTSDMENDSPAYMPYRFTLLFLNPDFFPVPYHVPPVKVGTNSEDSASKDDVGRQ